METESDICRRYESQFAEIAAQDLAYYLNPAPTAAHRRGYVARKQVLEQLRQRFYAELEAFRRRITTI